MSEKRDKVDNEKLEPGPGQRQSIWSVPSEWAGQFFMVFGWANAISIAYVLYDEIANMGGSGFNEILSSVCVRVTVHGGAIVIATIVAIEVPRSIMIAANYLRQRFLEPLKERQKAEGRAEGIAEGRAAGIVEGKAEGRAAGIAEGKAEGRAEGIAEYKVWLERKEDAQRLGLFFDEPEPGE